MLNTFVSEHLGTLIVGVIVAAIVGLLIFSLVKSRKKNGCGCGCGCTSCPMGAKCPSFKSGSEADTELQNQN